MIDSHDGGTEHRHRRGAGFGFPQKDPGPAPPLASGAAGSGLRPAYDGGNTEASVPPPWSLCPLGIGFADTRGKPKSRGESFRIERECAGPPAQLLVPSASPGLARSHPDPTTGSDGPPWGLA